MSNLPRGKCLRDGRVSKAGQIYLITAVTQHRTTVFTDWNSGRPVVEEFRNAQITGAANSLAWVIMPDHIHWLLELQDCQLTQLLQSVKSRSARKINQARCKAGQVWQRGFYDRALRREDDLLKVARYVVANPLRAGLVRNVGDYPLWDAVWL